MSHLIHLEIRNPKDDETPIEATAQIFSSLLPTNTSFFKSLFKAPVTYAFEIYLFNQRIYFYLSIPQTVETFVTSLITSSYPNVAVNKTADPLTAILQSPQKQFGDLRTSAPFLPLKTYTDFKNVDPLSPVVGFLSKRAASETIAIQVLVTPATFPWANQIISLANKPIIDLQTGRSSNHPQKSLLIKKTEMRGGKALVRLLIGATQTQTANDILNQLAGTFGAFSLGEGAHLVLVKPRFSKNKFLTKFQERKTGLLENRFQILNAAELATLWHLPGLPLSGVKNIAWGKSLSGEPPENLPIAQSASDQDKQATNYFAVTEFKNQPQIFGIQTEDRRKHIYIMGKTGAGKSTLIANMAIDDIRKGRGIGIIDPHGDLSEFILDYIPNRRVNDVVYLEPFDTDRPFRLNVLENKNKQHKDLIASGIVSIFHKLYGRSWGPRLEYILRNVILSLLEIPDATLVDVLPLLADNSYRQKTVAKITDPVIKAFWLQEFAQMPDKLRSEAVSPIQNKVGQFVSSTMIRNIIGHPKSSISLSQIMNQGQILILNLSQGKLGEDNSSLLGAMIITQVQLAAMERSFVKEHERKDFFLYVDEFQNFATEAFVKILSEARKFRLSLAMANQYIGQLEEPIQNAIFGNIGSLLSFVVGAKDAYILAKEFGGYYKENDLVSLGKFEIITKLSIDNVTSSPFPAKTLPLPSVKNDNRDKITRLSREKYGRRVKTAR